MCAASRRSPPRAPSPGAAARDLAALPGLPAAAMPGRMARTPPRLCRVSMSQNRQKAQAQTLRKHWHRPAKLRRE